VPAKKGLLLARYLIEPLNQVEIVYNENAKSAQSEILTMLQGLIGDYMLYKPTDSECPNENYVSEEVMQKQVVDRFGRVKQAFVEALKCEDYEEEGIIDLVTLKEAIISFDEEADEHLVDYMLYYVFARSKSPDMMEYKVLIKLINEGLEQRRIQSAQKKNRPESSSPEKLKMRNPTKPDDVPDEEEEHYSEEEIVQDEAVEEEESHEHEYINK